MLRHLKIERLTIGNPNNCIVDKQETEELDNSVFVSELLRLCNQCSAFPRLVCHQRASKAAHAVGIRMSDDRRIMSRHLTKIVLLYLRWSKLLQVSTALFNFQIKLS